MLVYQGLPRGSKVRSADALFRFGFFAHTAAVLAVAADRAQGCAILILGPPCHDLDWRAYVRAIDSLQVQINGQTRPVLIQVLRRGIEMPSAIVRREIAGLRGRIRTDAINAVVVEDVAIRLLQTALDWLHRPHYATSSHADFAAAVAKVEAVLGRPLPGLDRLYCEAIETYQKA